METGLQIQFLSHKSIDKNKWDACIDASGGLIYAYSFYLDHMAENWDAFVCTNEDASSYQAVMPLTWNRKYGITYLYQPFLTPQLGVFGVELKAELVELFIEAVQKRYRFAEINLNTSNQIEHPPDIFKEHRNYELSLREEYSKISSSFNSNLIRNCKKAVSAGATFRRDVPLEDMLRLANEQLEQYTRMKKDDLSRFKRLCEYFLQKGNAVTLGVYLENLLVASCILFFHKTRAYYILAGNHAEGRKIGASHFLLEQFIREESGKDLVLDFVGSDIESIAFFYEGFAAVSKRYFSMRYNKLPAIVKLFKK